MGWEEGGGRELSDEVARLTRQARLTGSAADAGRGPGAGGARLQSPEIDQSRKGSRRWACVVIDWGGSLDFGTSKWCWSWELELEQGDRESPMRSKG